MQIISLFYILNVRMCFFCNISMYTYDILQCQVSLHTLINMYLIGCMSASRNNDVLCFKAFTIPLLLHSYVALI
jgi:hypothetical protein